MHAFDFHEDDECQEEILPIANMAFCRRELEAIAAHAREHLAPNGVGWTKMYMRGPAQTTISSLKMSADQFAKALAPHAKQYDRVTSALDEIDRKLGIRRIGFGPTSHAGIIANLDDDLVASVWGRFFTTDGTARSVLADMLAGLNSVAPMMLVDWSGGRIGDLSSPVEVARYLAHE